VANRISDERDPSADDPLKQILNDIWDLPEFDRRKVAGVNDKSLAGNIPLHIAAVRGDLRAIEALVVAGSNLDARGEHGYTPLHEAVEQGHVEAVKILIGAGSSLTILNDDGLTAAALARELGDRSISDLFVSTS